ncbi:MAG: DUF3047 domain-containing protein [Sphingomicrobium sp.]
MALLARPLSVNLAAPPILCWRWLVDAPVARGDMTRKSGGDYAARLYVAFDMPDSALSAGTRIKLGIARRLFGSNVPDAALAYADAVEVACRCKRMLSRLRKARRLWLKRRAPTSFRPTRL